MSRQFAIFLGSILLLAVIVEADGYYGSWSSNNGYSFIKNTNKDHWKNRKSSPKHAPKASPSPPPPKKSKTPPVPAPAQSLLSSSAAYQFMSAQNAARLSLGLHPLQWDTKLESYARWWASQRLYAGCTLQHSGGPYGENIFWGSGKAWSPAEASQAWVSERKWYNYAANSCAGGQMCGHYTQIVWKGSTRIGCARVTCSSGDVFMTCNYDPPGNYIGERPY